MPIMDTNSNADAESVVAPTISVLPAASVFETRLVMVANGLASVAIVIALLAYGVQARPGGWAGLDATTPIHDPVPTPQVTSRHG